MRQAPLNARSSIPTVKLKKSQSSQALTSPPKSYASKNSPTLASVHKSKQSVHSALTNWVINESRIRGGRRLICRLVRSRILHLTSHDDYQEVLNSRFPGHLAEEDTTHETISVMSIDEDPSQPEATEPTVEDRGGESSFCFMYRAITFASIAATMLFFLMSIYVLY